MSVSHLQGWTGVILLSREDLSAKKKCLSGQMQSEDELTTCRVNSEICVLKHELFWKTVTRIVPINSTPQLRKHISLPKVMRS